MRGGTSAREKCLCFGIAQCFKDLQTCGYLPPGIILNISCSLFKFPKSFCFSVDCLISVCTCLQVLTFLTKARFGIPLKQSNFFVNSVQFFNAFFFLMLPPGCLFDVCSLCLQPLNIFFHIPLFAIMLLNLLAAINTVVYAFGLRECLQFLCFILNLLVECRDPYAVLMIAQTHRVNIVYIVAIFFIKIKDTGIREIKLTLYGFYLISNDGSNLT